MTDLYHQIYHNEIFQQSQCIWHENAIMDFFRHSLRHLGYSATDASNKIFCKGPRTVVICLVDDFGTCAADAKVPSPYWFDEQTTVITDNWIAHPTQYRVCRLPDSFFGIYSYQPRLVDFRPTRRFNLSINRIDPKRLALFLEVVRSGDSYPVPTEVDWLKINCWLWGGQNDTTDGLAQNFSQVWDSMQDPSREVSQESSAVQQVIDSMPFCNHEFSLEQSYVQAWLNIVAETYSGDDVVALSEKTFMALSTPSPWALYAGRYAVARLRALGFDVLLDMVPHEYDNLFSNGTGRSGDKVVDFVAEASNCSHNLSYMPLNKVCLRLEQAAAHNQQILNNMRLRWPGDFAQWWSSVIPSLT